MCDAGRAFVASREKTSHRRERQKKMKENMDNIMSIEERMLSMGQDNGEDWAIEARNRRVNEFKKRQVKLEKVRININMAE
jgi:hypothetical protein